MNTLKADCASISFKTDFNKVNIVLFTWEIRLQSTTDGQSLNYFIYLNCIKQNLRTNVLKAKSHKSKRSKGDGSDKPDDRL